MSKAKSGEKEECVHTHCCCGGRLIGGIILLAVGIAIELGWSFGQTLILIGGILVVKSLLLKANKRE